MKYSQLHTKTNKTGKEYDSVNATYLINGGFIDQTMAGVYTFLPLGLRVLRKIEQIVRQEMDTIGVEVMMPTLSPKSLWEQTGRLDIIDVLMKTAGANHRSLSKSTQEYIINCTHEEVVTPIAKQFNPSYRDFPFAYYQIQSKFRNEARAKSGLLRGREFRMKDLYSFHVSEQDLEDYYQQSKEVYRRVFKRLGLGSDTYVVRASGGDFTDNYSHEFQTRCESGEDEVFYAAQSEVAFNKEIAPSQAPEFDQSGEQPAERREVEGEGIVGAEALAKHLDIPIEKTTKTILFEADDGRLIAAAVRGEYDINEEKLRKVAGCSGLRLASAERVKQVTGAEVGYAGIIGLPDEVAVYLDDSLAGRVNFESGANRTNYHIINVNFGRDLPEPSRFYDIKMALAGDYFPETSEQYEVFRAAEVGNIFPLYTKFSDAFGYTFTDQQGKQQPVYMGSYGIGTSRVMGVLVEKFHDEHGIIWPEQVAPFKVQLVSLAGGESLAEWLHDQLQANQVEVLWDDRQLGAGEKLADADLIGCPIRLVTSAKNGNQVELKRRDEAEAQLLAHHRVCAAVS